MPPVTNILQCWQYLNQYGPLTELHWQGRSRRETCSTASVSTTNPAWTCMGL